MTTTEMKREIAQIPGAVAQLLAAELADLAAAADARCAADPHLMATVARDPSRNGILETARRLADQGAKNILSDQTTGIGSRLSIVRTAHPLTDPIAHVVAFYGFAEALAHARDLDPDHPPNLAKVTPTQ
jgi:glucosamine--fructose-6-phosphate aminotransferase (isomerizing)